MMAVPMESSLKIKFYLGEDPNGKGIIKTKNYGSIKPKAANLDLLTFAKGIEALQQYSIVGLQRIDNTSLDE